MFLVEAKYKKRCKRCKVFFPVPKSTPASREYCNDCRIMLGRYHDKEDT